jgi:hypothetical protein
MDPQTAPTFFTEMLQLNNGRLPPIIQTSRAIDSAWLQPVLHAIGAAVFKRAFTIVAYETPNAGPGFTYWAKTLLAVPQHIPDRQQYLSDPYSEYYYDGFVLGALAMTEAKSTDSRKWAPIVSQIANGTPGAVMVHTFAEGKSALMKGESIHYVGAWGRCSLTIGITTRCRGRATNTMATEHRLAQLFPPQA